MPRKIKDPVDTHNFDARSCNCTTQVQSSQYAPS